jgi:hypothetical protein
MFASLLGKLNVDSLPHDLVTAGGALSMIFALIFIIVGFNL